MRRQLERIVYKDYVYIDGARIKKERPVLVQHYVKYNCRELTAYDDFVNNYNQWLEENDLLEEVLKYYVNYYQNHCMIKTAPFKGITDLMRRLKEAGIRQVIVSNKPDAATKEIAERFFSGLTEFVIGEKEGLRRKPWPDMVDAAIGRLGLTKDECVYVGDSEVDVATAKNAAVQCISVLWGFRDRKTLEEAGAAAYAQTPEKLGDMIIGD